MPEWFNFILFPAVGAAIGAVTNRIAIQMLFRPYRPVYIAGVRVPFTPGVIPSRREQLARSIAGTFERNLLSGKDLHELVTGEPVRRLIDGKVDEFFQGFGPLGGMFGGMKGKVAGRIVEAIEEVADMALSDGGAFDVGRRIEERLNSMEVARLEELILEVTRRQLAHITFFGGILGGLIGLIQAALSAAL